jgi:hypothetical protein
MPLVSADAMNETTSDPCGIFDPAYASKARLRATARIVLGGAA